MSTNDPVTNPGGDGEVVNVTEARSGFRDSPMLWVLGVGLVLVFAALFGAWAFYSGPLETTRETVGQQATDAQAFDAPLTAPKQNDIGHPSPRTGEPANTGVGTGPDDPRTPAAPTGQRPGEANPEAGSANLP